MIVDFYWKQEGRLKNYNLLAEEFLNLTSNRISFQFKIIVIILLG
jgi:hypothetical protein